MLGCVFFVLLVICAAQNKWLRRRDHGRLSHLLKLMQQRGLRLSETQLTQTNAS